MQLIITDRNSVRSTRVLTLSGWHFALGSLAVLFFVSLFGSLVTYWTLKSGIKDRWPLVYKVISVATAEEFTSRDRFMRENLDAMAGKLGEVQAKLVRLEALGERVSTLAGVNPKEFNLKGTPGSGGALVPGKAMNSAEIGTMLDDAVASADNKAEMLSLMESRLLEQRVQKMMIPTKAPMTVGYVGSGFGWRIDPFTHQNALHTGLDFVAPIGTPILAAAGGVVMVAESNPSYGNMIEIDHGNGLVTRYGHASRLLVKPGDIVRPGQHIADSGSTGRSTGPHLHFEVLVDGVPTDPAKFLAAASQRGEKVTARMAAARP